MNINKIREFAQTHKKKILFVGGAAALVGIGFIIGRQVPKTVELNKMGFDFKQLQDLGEGWFESGWTEAIEAIKEGRSVTELIGNCPEFTLMSIKDTLK